MSKIVTCEEMHGYHISTLESVVCAYTAISSGYIGFLEEAFLIYYNTTQKGYKHANCMYLLGFAPQFYFYWQTADFLLIVPSLLL